MAEYPESVEENPARRRACGYVAQIGWELDIEPLLPEIAAEPPEVIAALLFILEAAPVPGEAEWSIQLGLYAARHIRESCLPDHGGNNEKP